MDGDAKRSWDHLSTNQKGALAEAGFSLAALRLGLSVFRAVSEHERYDLVLGIRSREVVRIVVELRRRSSGLTIRR
jgi:hypothetical protein